MWAASNAAPTIAAFLVGALGAAVVRWVSQPTVATKSTGPIDWRECTEAAADQMSPSICWNVRYTAALYALNYAALDVNTTWTYENQNKKRIRLREWLLLKKRHKLMMKALDELAVASHVCELYCTHRSTVHAQAYSEL